MNSRRIGTKRALSEIPTAAILLAGVTMMGLILVGWSNSTLSVNQVELDATFSGKVNRISEEIAVEKVWFGIGSSNKFINVTLANTSSLGLSITEIEFVNSTDTVRFLVSNADVLPDQTYSLEEVYGWSSGEPVDVIITTGRGNIFTSQVMPQ